jgi:hypothetical protein
MTSDNISASAGHHHHPKVRQTGGLDDLLGNRILFPAALSARADNTAGAASGARHEDAAASWAPSTAWFDDHPMATLFPKCQHPQWCDTAYDREETHRVQAALWAHQNPVDCNTARYLVLDTAYTSGLGSSLNIHLYALSLAMTDGRILVAGGNLTWPFAVPDLCDPAQEGGGAGDSGRVDGGRAPAGARYLDCYFVPTTWCPLPSAWEHARRMSSFDQVDRIVRSPAMVKFGRTSFCELTVQSLTPALAAFRDKPPSWWYAQLAKFALRPTEHMLRTLVWPLQHSAFYRHQGSLPHPSRFI